MADNNRVRLFENTITITGKHATYIKFLVNEAEIFDKYIDVYLCGAVVGYLYKVKAQRDNTSTDRGRIEADALATHKQDCMFLYRLITLLDSSGLDSEEQVNRAFRYDSDIEKEETVKECMENFNAYVRGGIERMYRDFTAGCINKDDYVRNSLLIAKNFKDELSNEVSYEERLKEEILK